MPTPDEAYRLAEKQIDEALRFQRTTLTLNNKDLTSLPPSIGKIKWLQMLDVSNNELTELPKSIGELTQLRALYLYNNQLPELPMQVSRLKQLTMLAISNNKLTKLPDWLGNFKLLRELDLYDNALTELPESMRQLTDLRELNLGGNKMRTLPDWLGRLTQLETLKLWQNQIATLPDWLADLTALRTLHVWGNQLTELPEWIGRLTRLQSLDASYNQLAALPDSLGQLTELKRLQLAGNQLTALPESLRSLRSLQELILHLNSDLGIPDEILGPTWQEINDGKKPADPHAILAFYFAQQNRTAKPLNEFRLLLVGHGRVGKTSLSKALRDLEHNKQEPETPGIERHRFSLRAGRSKLTAHVWDFGGQEFLHQTHQFFFSERSIYLVVLSGRQGRSMEEAEYWLRLIRTYGSGSPVVIALNQIKAHPFSVDEHFLQENYPEVQAVVKTDCDPRVGIDELHDVLSKVAGAMPIVKVEPEWERVRRRLEEMNESFVSFNEYRRICGEEGVNSQEDQERLAKLLNYLGIALNYRDDPRLSETSVLKPRWLVDGIYSILRWMRLNETNGELKVADLSEALTSKEEYPPESHRFLLVLMEKFELCFPLPGKDLYLGAAHPDP